jgi:hypothetical protein
LGINNNHCQLRIASTFKRVIAATVEQDKTLAPCSSGGGGDGSAAAAAAVSGVDARMRSELSCNVATSNVRNANLSRHHTDAA